MKAQEYLEELILDCEKRLKYSEKLQEENPGLFQKVTDLGDVSMEEMNKIFTASVFMADTKTIFQKIASFVYFMDKSDIELNLENLNKVKGLSAFVSEHTPFEFRTVEESEGIYKVKEDEVNTQILNNFKKSFNTISKIVQDDEG